MEEQSKGALKRKQIIAEAIKIVARSGVADLSYEALSQATGLARPHVKYYFKTKEDLLGQCFREIADVLIEMTKAKVESRHHWQDRVIAIMEATFDWVGKYPDHASVLFIYYHYCCVNKELAELQRSVRIVGRERIEGILLAGLSEKLKPREINVLAFNIQMYLTGVIMEMASTQSFHDQQVIKQAINYVKNLISTD